MEANRRVMQWGEIRWNRDTSWVQTWMWQSAVNLISLDPLPHAASRGPRARSMAAWLTAGRLEQRLRKRLRVAAMTGGWGLTREESSSERMSKSSSSDWGRYLRRTLSTSDWPQVSHSFSLRENHKHFAAAASLRKDLRIEQDCFPASWITDDANIYLSLLKNHGCFSWTAKLTLNHLQPSSPNWFT